MAKKFIIKNGEVVMSASITYHNELVKKGDEVKGGGLFEIEDDNIYLFGASFDFGQCDVEDIKKAVPESIQLDEYNVYFSYKLTFVDAKKECELIKQKSA